MSKGDGWEYLASNVINDRWKDKICDGKVENVFRYNLSAKRVEIGVESCVYLERVIKINKLD